MAAKTEKPDGEPEFLEHGNIYFFYRPKVEQHEPKGLDDAERFYLVLRPYGRKLVRLTVIGRKRLPAIDDHERNWGFVEKIAESAADIQPELREYSYDTKTRGDRTRPAARPAGEGIYALLQVGRDMHLVCALELPETPGPVQAELNIEQRGAFVVAIRNPEADKPPNVGLREQDEADYPGKLQREFRGRRFATADTRLLDYEGAEFILIGAVGNPERAYGVQLDPENESEESADIFKQLKLRRSKHPVEPLFTGEWS